MILNDPRELASIQKSKKKPNNDSKEVTAKVKKIRDDIEASWKSTQQWREAALESYKFVENEQWTDEEKKYLKDNKRPILTMNKVLPIVRILSGIERQNREDMRVFPRKGGGEDDAQLMTELIKFIDDENLGQWQRTRKSQDVYVTGRGFMKLDLSFDENLEGDIVFHRKDPLAIFTDPMSDSWDGSDWRWVSDSVWLTEDEVKELWPEFKDLIHFSDWFKDGGESPTADLSGDKHAANRHVFIDEKTKRVRLLEYWYKNWETVEVAIHIGTGDTREMDDNFRRIFQALPPEEQQKIRIVRRKLPVIRVASVINWLLLQDKPSPFNHRMFPIVPYVGMHFYNEPLGIVEYLKDAQRLRNKNFSQMLNHLNRSANSGWFNKAQGGADPAHLEAFGSTPGIVINYEEEKPDMIQPVQLSAGHFSIAKDADIEIKEISLINSEIQGLTTQTTVSGRAIEARQRGGLLGNEDFFDNQLLGDKILGTQIISLIKQVYTPERIIRIAESRGVRDPQGILNNILRDQIQLPFIIDNVLKNEYDFVVDHAPSSATIRQVQLQTILQAAKDFPGSIPPDVIVDLTDLPQQLKDRIKQHLQQQMQMQQLMAVGQSGAGKQILSPGGTGGNESPTAGQLAGTEGGF